MRMRSELGWLVFCPAIMAGCNSTPSDPYSESGYYANGGSSSTASQAQTSSVRPLGGTGSKGTTKGASKASTSDDASDDDTASSSVGGRMGTGGTQSRKSTAASTDDSDAEGNGGNSNGGTSTGAGGIGSKGGGANAATTKAGAGGTASTKATTSTIKGGTTAKGGTTSKGGTPGSGGTVAGDQPITGYFESGTWKGFGWTDTFGTGNTIAPEDFTGTTDWPMCAKGTVKAASDGSNGAMLGWSVNQAKEEGSPIQTVTPTKDGIIVNIKVNTAAALRLQIQGPNGGDDESQRWCTEIGSAGGENIFVPYDAFNSQCWPGGDGVPYNGEPIAQVIVQVPSSTADVNFDFCVNSIAEGDGGTTGGAGCDLSSPVNGTANSGTLAPSGGWFQRKSTNTGTPQIWVQNNVFTNQSGQYTVAYNGPSFAINSLTGSASTSGAPIGYPSLFIGSAGGDGQATAGSNLAKKVSAIGQIPTALRWSGGSGEFNIAYDVWFNAGSGDSGPGGRSFLMVWFHRTSAIYAEGQSEGHSGGTLSLNGKTFDIYVSDQFEGRPIISYVAKSTISEWSFDLADFIKDSKSRTSTRMSTPVINDNLYLTNVFAGAEVWSGASGLKVDRFCIQVQ